METTTTETTEVKTTSRSNYETLDESIAKMKLTFGNAMLPEIFTVMETVGYTAEKIAAINAELAQLEALAQGQIKERADQSEEQLKFDAKKEEVNKVFSTHRALARILFKGDIHSWVALQLDTQNPKAFATWMQVVANFYAQLSGNAAMLAKAQAIGITTETVADQKQGLADIQALKENLRKETAEAQVATDARDRAFDTLYPKYSEYVKYAKVLIPENQLLEAIGVKVRAR